MFSLIVGVKFKDTGRIFYDDIRIMVGRGSGKNGFIDFLAMYFISPYHNIKGYNVDILANSEDQAKVSFNDIYNFIEEPHDPRNLEALKYHYHTTKELITGVKTQSVIRFNTSSKRGKDSKRTGCVILDEKHEYLDSTNINTLKSGLGKVEDGRIITITTDGHVRGAVLDKDKEQNERILSSYDESNRTLVFYCHIESEEEWNNPEMWIKAIPSLNDFPALKRQIEKEVKDMPYTPDYYKEFMAKRMNYPVGDSEVEVATWEDLLATNQPIDEIVGKACVGGIDYAKTNDFIGCFLLFKKKDKVYGLRHTFVCKQSRDLRGIKAPLDEWAEKGWLTYVDDVEINADIVVDWFVEQKKKYKLNIKKIGVDNYRYSLLSNALKKKGFDALKTGKNNIKLVRPNDIMKAIPIINSIFIKHNLALGDAPDFRWSANNAKKINTGNNVIYGKQEPHYRKTDLFMAFVNACCLLEELDAPDFSELPDIDVIF